MKMKSLFQTGISLLAGAMLVAGCSSGGGDDAAPAPALTYTIGGTVSGLSGAVVLQNNGGDDLAITADGAFAFATALADGSAYNVTVMTQPEGQTCTASNNSGTVAGSNVTDVSVVCSVNSYTVGGAVTGLSGTVILTNNNNDDLSVASNGSFTFNTPAAYGAGYNVSVKTQPTGQTCTASNNSGTVAGSNVTDVSVVCSVSSYTVGGAVTGLSGTVILTNNNVNDLSVSANGSFTFNTPVAHGAGYNVTVKTAPYGQQCFVTGGSGLATANVTNVGVQCAEKAVLSAIALPRSVSLSWSDASATSYDVYYSTDPNCDIANIGSCVGGVLASDVASPYVVKNLVNGEHYSFWLKANYSGGHSTLSQGGARPDHLATDGGVNSVVTGADGATYLGGSFTRVGVRSGGGVPLAADAIGTRPFPRVDGAVHAVVSDGAGGWYIGGTFSRVGGIARNNIAHILADGSVGPWNPDANRAVLALAVSGATVYAGGDFDTIGGQARSYLAALDSTVATNNATAWNPGANSYVYVLAVSGTTVYAGGAFTNIGGHARNRIAALDATVNSNNATAWNPDADNYVRALAVRGTTVYAGGTFTNIGGQPRVHVAALDATAGNALAWNANAEDYGGVEALAVSADGATVYVGGLFSSIGGQERLCLAALDATTGNATGWDPAVDGLETEVSSLALTDTTIYVGGMFTSVAGQPRLGLAAFDINTGNVTAWNPWVYGARYPRVAALAVSGTTVYAGGDFTGAGGVARNRIASLDANGDLTDWNPDANGPVRALAINDDTLYIGGDFTSVGGVTRNRIAALNTTTGLATAWNPNATGSVSAIVYNTDLNLVYVGGSFFSIGGKSQNHLAAIDAAGSATAWHPDPSAPVLALAYNGGASVVYAGGWFTSIGGQARNGIAALNTAADTNNATAWSADANGYVYALALSGSTLYAGGDFTTIGGQARGALAALDTTSDTNNVYGWNPNISGDVTYRRVLSLAVSTGAVFAGGEFTSAGGEAAANFAAVPH